MARPRAARQIPTSAVFDFISGCFHLSKWRIPYFATTMTLHQAANYLKHVNEFPAMSKVEWTIDELYQRDLDWARVERKIVPYLNSPDAPQFFNALTVALVPTLNSKRSPDFAGAMWNPPGIDGGDRFEKTLSVGPISLGYYESWIEASDPGARLGQLCWNTSEVFSVAIDGQHRLAAIKVLARGLQYDPKVTNSQVPVILLVFDPRVGFVNGSKLDLTAVMRKVFIDLNKHAIIVSRTRQILLDDRDPHSLCVRGLIGRAILDGRSDLDGAPPRLPLTLVDWHTDRNKVDDGPYLVTIRVLDFAVTTLLETKAIDDFMDYRQVERQLRALEGGLGVELDAAWKRLAQLRGIEKQPFGYQDDSTTGELTSIADAFVRVWGSPTVTLLTRFAPYAALLEERDTGGSLTGDFAAWYQLRYRSNAAGDAGSARDEHDDFVQQLASREDDPVGVKELEGLLSAVQDHKKGNLAFNIAFQRAYLLAFKEFYKIEDEDIDEVQPGEDLEDLLDVEGERDDGDENGDEGSDASDDGRSTGALAEFAQRRADQYVAALNAMVEARPTLLDKDCSLKGASEGTALWLGTIRKADGTIDFTLGASARALELLVWVATVHLCWESDDPSVGKGFKHFWQSVLEPHGGLRKRLKKSVVRFKKAAKRICSMRGNESPTDEQTIAEAECRMQWIWQALRR